MSDSPAYLEKSVDFTSSYSLETRTVLESRPTFVLGKAGPVTEASPVRKASPALKSLQVREASPAALKSLQVAHANPNPSHILYVISHFLPSVE